MSKTEIIAELPHLSPAERAEVRAKLDELSASKTAAPAASPQMIAQRKAALQRLRALGGLRQLIPDPAAWQRDMRQDRPLSRL